MLKPHTLIGIGTLISIVLAISSLELKSVDNSVLNIDGANYRLPNNTHPESYDISLVTRVDVEDFDFSGLVKIRIVVDHPTREIVLHARQLVITNVKLTKALGLIEVKTLPFKYDNVREFLKIPIDGVDLNTGDRLRLDISYHNTLRKDGGGFYRSFYTNTLLNRVWFATTQFAPTNARHAFPCFDEPAMKAKFTIRITHGNRYNAISNMPETTIPHDDDTSTTSFTETPIMSTYLIAFVVSDFQFVFNTSDSNVFRQRIFSKPASLADTRFALRSAERLLDAIKSYLGVEYTPPKIDHVVIPGIQHRVGGMQNWGLITYNEQNLLYREADYSDNSDSDYSSRRQVKVAKMISHELSHQLFGNMVSPKWWNYIWLNEGMATLFELIGTDLVYPEWNMVNLFVTDTVQGVLKTDSSNATRPMSQYVERPETISRLFDNIAYAKSGSVLRMFMHALTEGSFKKGIGYYLKDHAFKSADEDDLFASMEKAVKEDGSLGSNLTIRDIFSSWSNQRGYPLLSVDRDYQSGTITLKQSRFFSSRVQPIESTSWWIPYNYATSSNPNFNLTSPDGWLPQNTKTLTLMVTSSPDEWVVFNKQQTGFYRVVYDDTNYKLISKQLHGENLTAIHVLSRSQMLDDLDQFLLLGLVKVDTFFDFYSYLKNETDYAPWVPAVNTLFKLRFFLSGSKYYENYRKFVATLSEKLFQTTGVEAIPNEDNLQKLSRILAIDLACEFGLQICLTETYRMLYAHLHVDLNSPTLTEETLSIYNNGMRSARKIDARLVWFRFTRSEFVAERYMLLSTFKYIQNPEVIEEFFVQTLADYPGVSLNERNYLLDTLCSANTYGIGACIEFLRGNVSDVQRLFGSLDRTINRIANRIRSTSTRKQFEDLLNLLKDQSFITEETVFKANKLIDENFEEISQHQEELEAWISKWSSSSNMFVSSLTLVLAASALLILLHYK